MTGQPSSFVPLFCRSLANLRSLRCIQVIAGVLGRAGQEGQTSRLKHAAKGHVTYQATHGFNAPASEGLSRETNFDFNPNIADPEPDSDRLLTSSTDLENDPSTDLNLEATYMAAYEYAKFADFQEDAIHAALNMFEAEAGSESSELAELRQKLHEAKQAHGIEETKGTVVDSQEIDEDTALAMESEVDEMMDEPVTDEEAAALHAQDGGEGKNLYEGLSYRTALKRRKDAEDPSLARMVALKRRQYGEELSASDTAELKKHDDEQTQRQQNPADEGELALRR